MKIISGHQPTYLPWPGLFHKVYLSDAFVYMDTVQYLEQDWNNRNRIRTPHGWTWLTVPIDRKKSKAKSLDQIMIRGHEDPTSKNFWQHEHWKSLLANYKKTPFFDLYADALHAMYVENVWTQLNDLCWAQFQFFLDALSLADREIVRMSEFQFSGHKADLVLDHCVQLKGDAVVFGCQGANYVDPELFTAKGIKIHFQDFTCSPYTQRYKGFEAGLSALDLLMNVGPDSMQVILEGNLTRADLLSDEFWL